MTELTDRMRTCAAYILSHTDTDTPYGTAVGHAADLLIEASNVLEKSEPSRLTSTLSGQQLGEPMQMLPPDARQAFCWPPARQAAMEIEPPAVPDKPRQGTSPPRPRTCPKCGSRAAKRARVEGTTVTLTCPACAAQWPYVSDGKWL